MIDRVNFSLTVTPWQHKLPLYPLRYYNLLSALVVFICGYSIFSAQLACLCACLVLAFRRSDKASHPVLLIRPHGHWLLFNDQQCLACTPIVFKSNAYWSELCLESQVNQTKKKRRFIFSSRAWSEEQRRHFNVLYHYHAAGSL